MWKEGLHLAEDPETDFVVSPLAEDMWPDLNLRRSTDGEWVVRRCYTLGAEFSVEQIVTEAAKELTRLQQSGVNVISRNLILFDNHESVMSVTPWIPNIKVCSPTYFEEHIRPFLDDYYKTSTGEAVLRRVETSKPWQYSTGGTPELATPFLHDIDPLVDRVV